MYKPERVPARHTLYCNWVTTADGTITTQVSCERWPCPLHMSFCIHRHSDCLNSKTHCSFYVPHSPTPRGPRELCTHARPTSKVNDCVLLLGNFNLCHLLVAKAVSSIVSYLQHEQAIFSTQEYALVVWERSHMNTAHTIETLQSEEVILYVRSTPKQWMHKCYYTHESIYAWP